MENEKMFKQYQGVLELIIKMLKDDIPKEKIIEYIETLKNEN